MSQPILEFTGNWYIDLGILGFVNILNEEWGYSPKKLREELQSRPDIIFEKQFAFAYIAKNLKPRILNWKPKQKKKERRRKTPVLNGYGRN